MAYGQFTDAGRSYKINTPFTPSRWDNMLFNDNYLMEVSQTLEGSSSMVENYAKKAYTTGYRNFYILNRGTGEAFCPSYAPLGSKLDSFSCTHSIESTTINSLCDNIEASIRVFVPAEKQCEVWTVSITNKSEIDKEISAFSVFPFENSGPMGGECRYLKDDEILYKYSFPYHVYYEDKFKVENQKAYYFVYSDKDINSYDGSAQRFFGGSSTRFMPIAVKNGACSNIDGEAETFVGAVEHRLNIKPGKTESFNIVVGVAASIDEIRVFKENFDIDKEYTMVCDLWEKRLSSFIVETPDSDLNNLVNYWTKKQVILLTRLNRMSTYCPVRNQLQDALGYSLIEPEEALEFALKVAVRQQFDGFLKQWYMTDGAPDRALCLVKHGDAPIWLILCLIEIIDKCGDASIYDRKIGYIDSDSEDSIYNHLIKAAKCIYKMTGQHGLCLMLDGDWTDPINGAGRLGKGESTWSTVASIYAIKRLLEVCRLKNDTENEKELIKIIEELDKAVNDHCWDGEWYVTGFDDNGEPFGKSEDKEAKIFLNSQTWAIISGVARDDRLEKVKKSIESLSTPFGPLLLKPAFDGWNDTWGRISIKQAGTTENGSVYCHASMFKAFADCMEGDGNAAYKTVVSTLPTNPDNPPEVNLQFPTFVPNYYFGLENSPNYGRSSCHYGTGTGAWLLWVVLEHLLGVRRTVEGIKLLPHLPDGFKGSKVILCGREIIL